MEEIEENKDSEKTVEKRKSNIKELCFGWVKDNYDKLFIAILILAFILRIWIFIKTMNQPFWWDEADYLAAAKKWAGLNPNLVDIWYYRRGFLWPLISSLFFRIGVGEIGMRLLVALLSTGIVAVSYFIIKKMFNKKIALLTSIALSASWIFIFFTGRVLTDLPSAFFILLALLFFWKGYVLKEGNKFTYLFGLAFGIAVLIRMQSFIFAIPFLFYIFTKEKFKMFKNKHLWIALGLFALLLIPQVIMYTSHYGNPITDILGHYFGVKGMTSDANYIQRTPSTLFVYFANLPYMLGGQYQLGIATFILFLIGVCLFFFDFILGLDKIFKNEEVKKKSFIFLWIVIPFLVLGYITDYVEQRYISADLIFLFFIAIFPLIKIDDYFSKKEKFGKKKSFVLVFFIVILLLIPNFTWGKDLTEAKSASYLEVQQAGVWIKENSNQTDIVMTASRPQIVYYSERSVQSSDPLMWDNATYFESNVAKLKPKYLVLSSYEQSPNWLYEYPQNNTEKLTPVKAFYQNQQPIVVIYEFHY
jgi:4-amino-4-deoxy-L-arabinose transferase-like glycosyltransferase